MATQKVVLHSGEKDSKGAEINKKLRIQRNLQLQWCSGIISRTILLFIYLTSYTAKSLQSLFNETAVWNIKLLKFNLLNLHGDYAYIAECSLRACCEISQLIS